MLNFLEGAAIWAAYFFGLAILGELLRPIAHAHPVLIVLIVMPAQMIAPLSAMAVIYWLRGRPL